VRQFARNDDAAWNEDPIFDMAECTIHQELLETRGERLSLSRLLIRFRDGSSGTAEVEMLQVVEIDSTGVITAQVAFDLDDLAAARTELHRRGDDGLGL